MMLDGAGVVDDDSCHKKKYLIKLLNLCYNNNNNTLNENKIKETWMKVEWKRMKSLSCKWCFENKEKEGENQRPRGSGVEI